MRETQRAYYQDAFPHSLFRADVAQNDLGDSKCLLADAGTLLLVASIGMSVASALSCAKKALFTT